MPGPSMSCGILRRAPHLAVASTGGRSSDAIDVDLCRACDSEQHLLVSLGDTGVDGTGRRAIETFMSLSEAHDS
jgi:hypothetical protein